LHVAQPTPRQMHQKYGSHSPDLHSTGVMTQSSSAASLAASSLAELTVRLTSKRDCTSSATQPAFRAKQFYHIPFEEAYSDLAKQRNLRKLGKLFKEADIDGSGTMSLEELREAMQKPWIVRTFAALGVQPHQSDMLFRCLIQGTHKTELTLHEFIEGLTTFIHTTSDGSSRELDVGLFRPTRDAKQQRQGLQATPALHMPTVGIGLNLPPIHFMPEDAVRSAFVHTAAAKALHSPRSSRLGSR